MAKREVHNAVVTRNTDTDLGVALRGGVFFKALSLFEGEYPLPAMPCFPFASDKGAGFFYVPKVGDEIEVEISVDDGTDDSSDVAVPEPRWRCMLYSSVADIAAEFAENYPFRMGWKSNSGHIILMDDKPGQEKVMIASGGGHAIIMDDSKAEGQILILGKNGNLVQFDKDGSVKIVGKDGGYLFVDSKNGKISGVSKDGAFWKLDEDAVISDSTGKNMLALAGDDAQITAKKNVILQGESASLNAASVILGGSAEDAVLYGPLKSVYDRHKHPTIFGPSGSPMPTDLLAFAEATPATSAKSACVKLKGNLPV